MSKTTLIGLILALDYVDGWFPAYAGMTALVLDGNSGNILFVEKRDSAYVAI